HAVMDTHSSRYAAFVTKLNTDGSALVYSTYLAGLPGRNKAGSVAATDTLGNVIALDAMGNAYVAGETCASNFPVEAPFQQSNGAQIDAQDGFVTKLDP